MLPIRLLSAPPAIAIDVEPRGVNEGGWPPVSVEGFVLVPAWRARPARGGLRVLAMLPAFAVAAAVVVSVGPSHDATPTPLRTGPKGPAARARPALVVQATPAPASEGARARR